LSLALAAEAAWGNTKPLAKEPTEGARAFESYCEADGGYVVVRMDQQAAGGVQAGVLQELHRSPAKCQSEHALEMERGEARDAGDRGHGQRPVVAGEQNVARAPGPVFG